MANLELRFLAVPRRSKDSSSLAILDFALCTSICAMSNRQARTGRSASRHLTSCATLWRTRDSGGRFLDECTVSCRLLLLGTLVADTQPDHSHSQSCLQANSVFALPFS
jgi:hypothetical protein